MGWFDGWRKQGSQQGPPRPGFGARPQEAWIVEVEHAVLKVVSLVFSFGSAYAIAQVFAPYNGDRLRLVVDFMIAGGFGVLGYFLSRSIAYRLFKKEHVWAYLPICVVVELVEVFCNYVMGASEVPHEQWMAAIPLSQRPTIAVLAYVVLSIIPAVTLFLAVADMDLERRKREPKPHVKTPHPLGYQQGYQQGYQGTQTGRPIAAGGAQSPSPYQPRPQGGQHNGAAPLGVHP